jgi:hypothetical protein
MKQVPVFICRKTDVIFHYANIRFHQHSLQNILNNTRSRKPEYSLYCTQGMPIVISTTLFVNNIFNAVVHSAGAVMFTNCAFFQNFY